MESVSVDQVVESEEKVRDDLSQIADDYESLKRREGNGKIRDSVRRLFEEGRFSQIFDLPANSLTKEEIDFFVEQLKNSPNSPDFANHFKIFRQFNGLGIDVDKLFSEGSYPYSRYGTELDYRLWKSFCDSLGSHGDYEKVFLKAFSEASDEVKNVFVKNLNTRFTVLFREKFMKKKAEEMSPPEKLKTGFVDDLYQKYEGDLGIVKEEITQHLEEKVPENPREAIKALSRVNPGRVISLYEEGNLEGVISDNEIIDCLIQYSPDDLLFAIERGVISQEIVTSKWNLFAQYYPELSLKNLQNSRVVPEGRRTDFLVASLINIDLLELLELVENNPEIYRQLNKSSEAVKDVIERKLVASLGQFSDAKDQFKFLKRLEGYPYISEGHLIDRYRLEVFLKQTEQLRSAFKKDLDKFIESYLQDTNTDKSEMAIAEQTGSYLRALRTQYLGDFPELSDELNFCFAYELMQGAEGMRNFKIIKEFEGFYGLNNYSCYQREALKNLICEKGFYNSDILSCLNECTDGSKEQDTRVIYFLNKVVDDFEKKVRAGIPPEEIEEMVYCLNNVSETVKNVKGEKEIYPRLVKVICTQDRFLDEFSIARMGTFSPVDYLLDSLPPLQQEEMLFASKKEQTYCYLKRFRFTGPERKRELFSQLRDDNEYLQVFNSYDEFVAYGAIVKDPYPKEMVRRLMDMREKIGHQMWVKVIKRFPEHAIEDYKIENIENLLVAFDSSNPFLTDVVFRNYRLFLGHKISPEEAKLFGETAKEVRKDPTRFKADMELLGYKIPADIERQLAILSENPEKITQEDEKQQTLNTQLELYALIKWQSLTTGMTIAQIKELAETMKPYTEPSGLWVSSPYKGIEYLVNQGIWGEPLMVLYKNRKAFTEAMAEGVVTEKVGLSDIIDTDDIEASIRLVSSNASSLGTTDPTWERLVVLAVDQAIAKSSMAVLIDGELKDKDPEIVRRLRENIYGNLERVFSVSLEEKEQASSRNNETLVALMEAGEINIPVGAVTHATRTKSLPLIVSSGNLAGECIGKVDKKTDSFPGYVDVQEVDDSWGKMAATSILKSPEVWGSSEALIVYFPGVLSEKRENAEPFSGHKGHRLIAGGIPSVEASLIILHEPTEEQVDKIVITCVINNIFIPLISSKDGKLLFSYAEFLRRKEELKRFDNLEEMVGSSEVYSVELQETRNTNPVYTVAEHMEKVVGYATELNSGSPLDEETSLVLLAAAKLHDTGKLDPSSQELSNVSAAAEILDFVIDVTSEQKRKILLLIRNDELLGEVLKGVIINPDGSHIMTNYAKNKLAQFERIFKDEQLRSALVLLYKADVKGIGGNEYKEWQIEDKLKILGI